MNSEILETDFVALKILNEEFLGPYEMMIADQECRKMTGTIDPIPTTEQVKGWLSSRQGASDRYDWAIITKDSSEMIGEIVLSDIDDDNKLASLRICIFRRQNEGLGTDATKKVLEFAFTQLQLNRVEIEVFEFNKRAIHLYEKLGFKREGKRREVLLIDDTFHSALDMSILRSEYC